MSIFFIFTQFFPPVHPCMLSLFPVYHLNSKWILPHACILSPCMHLTPCMQLFTHSFIFIKLVIQSLHLQPHIYSFTMRNNTILYLFVRLHYFFYILNSSYKRYCQNKNTTYFPFPSVFKFTWYLFSYFHYCVIFYAWCFPIEAKVMWICLASYTYVLTYTIPSSINISYNLYSITIHA